MRISDWSSDVCSSDLEDAREDQVQARHAAAGDPVLRTVDDIAVAAPVGPRRHLGGRTAGAGLGDADGRLVAVEHHAGRKLLLLVAAIGHDGGDGAHVGLDRDAAGDGAGPAHLRSEEHTSEIQYIMRISYA